MRALLTADRNQRFARVAHDRGAARRPRPRSTSGPFIIADADTGHGGDAHVRNLIRRFVEVGRARLPHRGPEARARRSAATRAARCSSPRTSRSSASTPRASSSTSWACPASSSPAPTPRRRPCSTAAATSATSRSSWAPPTSTLPTYKVGVPGDPAGSCTTLGVDEHQRPPAATRSRDDEYADADAWLERAGRRCALIDDGARRSRTAEGAASTALLDKVDDRFVEAWQAEAGLKTYGEAVADVIAFRAERGRARSTMTVERVAGVRRSAPRSTTRARRRGAWASTSPGTASTPRRPRATTRCSGGIDYAIAKSLAAAPFADLLWMETKTADLDDAQRVRRGDPRRVPRQDAGLQPVAVVQLGHHRHERRRDARASPRSSASSASSSTSSPTAATRSTAWPPRSSRRRCSRTACWRWPGCSGSSGCSSRPTARRRPWSAARAPTPRSMAVVGPHRRRPRRWARARPRSSTWCRPRCRPSCSRSGWRLWREHHELRRAAARSRCGPHTAGSELLELRVARRRRREGRQRRSSRTIQDRRGRSILSVRDQNTFDTALRKKRLMTLVHLFLIHRYKVGSVHYLTPTEDNQRQAQKHEGAAASSATSTTRSARSSSPTSIRRASQELVAPTARRSRRSSPRSEAGLFLTSHGPADYSTGHEERLPPDSRWTSERRVLDACEALLDDVLDRGAGDPARRVRQGRARARANPQSSSDRIQCRLQRPTPRSRSSRPSTQPRRRPESPRRRAGSSRPRARGGARSTRTASCQPTRPVAASRGASPTRATGASSRRRSPRRRRPASGSARAASCARPRTVSGADAHAGRREVREGPLLHGDARAAPVAPRSSAVTLRGDAGYACTAANVGGSMGETPRASRFLVSSRRVLQRSIVLDQAGGRARLRFPGPWRRLRRCACRAGRRRPGRPRRAGRGSRPGRHLREPRLRPQEAPLVRGRVRRAVARRAELRLAGRAAAPRLVGADRAQGPRDRPAERDLRAAPARPRRDHRARPRSAWSARTRSRSRAREAPARAGSRRATSSSRWAASRAGRPSRAPSTCWCPTTSSTCRRCRAACWSSAPATSASRWPASSTAWAPTSRSSTTAPRLLRGFDADVQEHLEVELLAQGIDLRFQCSVSRVERTGQGLRVSLDSGAVVEVDAVLAAIGRVPRTRELGLEAVGREAPARRRGQRRRPPHHRGAVDPRRRRRGRAPRAHPGRDRRGHDRRPAPVRRRRRQRGRHPLRPRPVGRVLEPADRHRRADRGGGARRLRGGQRLSLRVPPAQAQHDRAQARARS